MPQNLAQKLIKAHLVSGAMKPKNEIALRIDQTLTQDATGTLVMLELEALDLDRVRTETSVQYVDHNLIQADNKNADDHLFLESACRRFGLWFSRPGNGVSHPVHQQYFGVPGKTLLGSDSHTCAAGAIAMLAMGAGGVDVAMAMAGEPYYIQMPAIWGVKLTGELPPWVSAKDIILEMLRRHSVKGGVGRIIEYYGPGLASLSAMDRHTIANMGAELGATASVFPSDDITKAFFASQGREDEWVALAADEDAWYDVNDAIELSALEPLIALPSSPDNVKPVREVAGDPIYQAYVGSSANPGFRDFAVAAEIVKGRQIPASVSFDINPTSRQILDALAHEGHLASLIRAGARIHQTGCNGCIGMGQAPATDGISLRTVPRNFPGRSGTDEDKVYLVSPETAAASALKGVITDPRALDAEGIPYPTITEPERYPEIEGMLQAPLPPDEAKQVDLRKGPNIQALPEFDALPDRLELPVLLKMGDNVSTDGILPAGARVLPFRSNIPAISQFAFGVIDESYPRRAEAVRDKDGHCVVGGENYGQGSSREHAALAPRFLGLRAVAVKSFARIHRQNLVNFGILPLVFRDPADYDRLNAGDVLVLDQLPQQLAQGGPIEAHTAGSDQPIAFDAPLSERQRNFILAGGIINWTRERLKSGTHEAATVT